MTDYNFPHVFNDTESARRFAYSQCRDNRDQIMVVYNLKDPNNPHYKAGIAENTELCVYQKRGVVNGIISVFLYNVEKHRVVEVTNPQSIKRIIS